MKGSSKKFAWLGMFVILALLLSACARLPHLRRRLLPS